MNETLLSFLFVSFLLASGCVSDYEKKAIKDPFEEVQFFLEKDLNSAVYTINKDGSIKLTTNSYVITNDVVFFDVNERNLESLSEEQISELNKLIYKSNFFDLNNSYGDEKCEDCYKRNITVTTEKKKKKIYLYGSMQDFPSSPWEPEEKLHEFLLPKCESELLNCESKDNLNKNDDETKEPQYDRKKAINILIEVKNGKWIYKDADVFYGMGSDYTISHGQIFVDIIENDNQTIIESFSIIDPRWVFIDRIGPTPGKITGGSRFQENTEFFLTIDFHHDLRRVNIYEGKAPGEGFFYDGNKHKLLLSVDLSEKIYEFCKDKFDSDSDCVVRDSDNDGITDKQETVKSGHSGNGKRSTIDECLKKEDDVNDFLFKICSFIKAKGFNPLDYGIRYVEDENFIGRSVWAVHLDCCYMGDYAYIDKETGRLLYFWLGGLQECINKIGDNSKGIPGEILISFKDGIQKEEIMELMEKYELTNHDVHYPKNIEENVFGTIEVKTGKEAEWICRLKEEEIVSNASYNYLVKAFGGNE